MKNCRHPLFLLSLLLFLLNQMAEHFHYYLPFIHSYLDDFLFFPIILTPALSVAGMFNGSAYTFSIKKITWTVVYVSAVMEVVLPCFYSGCIGDPLDVAMYAAGAIVFHFTINNQKKFPIETVADPQQLQTT